MDEKNQRSQFRHFIFLLQEEHWKIEPYIPKDENEDDNNEVRIFIL